MEILNRWNLTVIFTSTKETIKEAMQEANLRGADLYGANLYGANLRGADLYGANLQKADLYGADLQGADLQGADLQGADLQGANLQGADLRGADLQGANLYGADLQKADLYGANLYGADLRGANLRGADLQCSGNMKELRTMQIDTYKIGFTLDTLQIGCQRHLIKDWKEFTNDKIAKMDSNSLAWWNKWKAFIFQAIELSKKD